MTQATEEMIRYFEAAGTVRTAHRQDIIYLQGDSAPQLYLVAKGRVRMFFIGEDGREVTYQIIGEGQIFGESAFLSHVTRPASMSAVTDVMLISCNIHRLLPFPRAYPQLGEAILELLADNYQFLCNQVKRLSVYDRYQRIASYLLEQTLRDNGGVGIVDGILPYTHEELGVCLNLNRVTVTKVLNEFQAQGLVKLGRKQIQVTDRDGLLAVVHPDSGR